MTIVNELLNLLHAQTQGMTLEQRGAFYLLVYQASQPEKRGTLPDDVEILRRWLSMTPEQFDGNKLVILSNFAAQPGGRLINEPLARFIESFELKKKSRSVTNRENANRRWQPSSPAAAQLPLTDSVARPPNATAMQRHSSNDIGSNQSFSKVRSDSNETAMQLHCNGTRLPETLWLAAATVELAGFLKTEAEDLVKTYAKEPEKDWERLVAAALQTLGAEVAGNRIGNRVAYALTIVRNRKQHPFQKYYDEAATALERAKSALSQEKLQ